MCGCPRLCLTPCTSGPEARASHAANSFMLLGALLELPSSADSQLKMCSVWWTPMGSSSLPCNRDRSTGPLIQAPQSHSLQKTELELMPVKTPEALSLMLIHGIFWQHWPSILLKVLFYPGRMHIHLAPGLHGDPSVISDMRPNCEVAVVSVGPWHPLLLLCQWGDAFSRECS